jgi:hypothetical protein
MSTSHEVQESRAVPVPVEQAYGFVLPEPLPTIFDRWYGPIPPVKEVTGQDGDWGTVGQSRTIHTADGGSILEQLTTVEPHQRFGYTLTEITGPMKFLLASVDGQWSFEPVGTGVRITWSWTLHPASQVADVAMPFFGWIWKGYARQALARIEELLLAT